MMQCECEHDDHSEGWAVEVPCDEGPAHPYSKAKAVRKIKTEYGTFALCDACHKAGHMQRPY